jgi:chorismate synthase
MAGSHFGRFFKVSTFGESHGEGLGVILDGVPPLLDLDVSDIQKDLDRRRPGQSAVTTPRKEADQVEILSGVFEGKTTGAPIALLIRNTNQQSKDYSELKTVFRPGHADFSFWTKYGIRDHRGGGRSSGRETAARVAAGAIAKKYLAHKGIQIIAYTKSVADIQATRIEFGEIEKNPVRCPDPEKAKEMEALIEKAKAEHDSLGGIIEAQIIGCPAGLGDPVFDKLDAVLSHALMSIGTIKGIEFGDGFESTRRKGSENNDGFYHDGEKFRTTTNHAGGILGGISTGEPIILRVAVKPASSIAKSQQTSDQSGVSKEVKVEGRHDPCICPRAVPVIEAMSAIAILDAYLIQSAIRPLEQKDPS